jgi:hypothetical protein
MSMQTCTFSMCLLLSYRQCVVLACLLGTLLLPKKAVALRECREHRLHVQLTVLHTGAYVPNMYCSPNM